MSFRYTNNLIGVLKHRLALEAAHRDIARRTFTGISNGVKVTCSGYGSVLRIEMIDRDVYEPFYTPAPSHSLDLDKLSVNIKAALWDAIRKVQSAKMAAHHRSLVDNEQMLSHGRLQHWYEQDVHTIQPRPSDALKQELATPWMQAVRFGKRDAERFLAPTSPHEEQVDSAAKQAEGVSVSDNNAERTPDVRGVTVLTREDCHVANIPIGSVHPLFTSALVQLEEQEEQTASNDTKSHRSRDVARRQAAVAVCGATGKKWVYDGSRVCGQAVLREFKREMSRDELRFWERVELIRRGQLANIPGG